MYDYFKGFITDKRKTSKGLFITIETASIGYLLEVIEQDFMSLQINEEHLQKIYIFMTHREDAMSLYGFSNKETRDIFQILLSVSGVGAKMALALLNEFDACNLISLVINGDFKELTKAKGVGPKLAQKIILELKDKLKTIDVEDTSSDELKSVISQNNNLEELISALQVLGYTKKEVEKIIPKLDNKDDNLEILIKKALLLLSK